jgi:hypothetical protein
MPSILAVLRLMTSSNLVGCKTGNTPPENRSAGYDAAKAALMNAINRKRLPALIAERDDTDSREVDWHRTVVAVEDMKRWLRSRGIGTGFFFPALPSSFGCVNMRMNSGSPRKTAIPTNRGIEEVAKVANWDTKGGAPKTPF